MEICPALQPLFAFEIEEGNFTYCKLRQGWNWSPRLFYTRVASLLQDLAALNYIHDLIVGGKDIQEHNLNLNMLLKRLKETGLTVNKKKQR